MTATTSPEDRASAEAPSLHVATFTGAESIQAGPALGRGRIRRNSGRVVAAVCALGFLLTAIGTWGAVRTDQNTEERLLAERTLQAAAVLSSAISDLQQPLEAALDVQASVLPSRRATAFGQRFALNVGEGKPFVSASLWRSQGRSLSRLATLGAPPGLAPRAPVTRAFLRSAARAETSVVTRVEVGPQVRIAYALHDPATGFIVYAERAIPANRRAPVDQNPAYAGLDYAIYLGTTTETDLMTTTDVDPAELPLTGRTASTTVPFGDTVLTLVTSPREHLGGTLSRRLAWIVAIGGTALTLLAAAVARQVLRSRNRAESDTRTITTLYQRVDTLYGEQRDLSVRLQRALLPRTIPDIPGLEIAAEYIAGAKGIDIGGDWYSVIDFDEDRFAFVVGDVSGHGVDAVAEMARARFTLRAYLVDGIPPADALEKCARQFDIARDGHLVTVVAGVGSWRTGELTVASAGHPAPLLVAGDGSGSFVKVPVGPPLGTGAGGFAPTTFTLPVGSTLFCFTDGLVERRSEDIDVGLRRLVDSAGTAVRETGPALADVVAEVLDAMRDDDRSDDIAILALRRGEP